MTYRVCSFIGDYPLDHQMYWHREYKSKQAAMLAARFQHQMIICRADVILRKNEIYTVVIDVDENSDEDVYFLINKDKEYTNPKKALDIANQLAGV
jgi:hypothetical protein